jgi:branched-chain amino acid transport system permease protein
LFKVPLASPWLGIWKKNRRKAQRIRLIRRVSMSLGNFLQLLASGITIGAVYGLVALSFVTIYRCSGIVNFAQGEFVMIGGLLCAYFLKTTSLPYPVAAAMAVVAVGLIGILTYQVVLVPLGQAIVFSLVMATLGVSMLLQNVALVSWGAYPLYLPPFSAGAPLRFGQVAIMSQSVWVLSMAVVVLVLLYIINQRTRFGKTMTATASDRLAASLVGISTGSMIRWSFAISGMVGAIAGIFVGPVIPLSFGVGAMFGLKGFVAAALGGWGKSTGAVFVGLVLGVIESISAGLLPSGYKDAVAFIVLILILYYRPSGILGASFVGEVE